MKKLFIVLMVAICLFSISTVTFANSGSAIIPYFLVATTYQPEFYFSNITNEPITVKIAFYSSNGSIISGNYITAFSLTPITLDKSDPNVSVTFSLNGRSTGGIYISGIMERGYGIVQWSQNAQNIEGLVATSQLWYHNSNGSWSFTTIDINNGLPF